MAKATAACDPSQDPAKQQQQERRGRFEYGQVVKAKVPGVEKALVALIVQTCRRSHSLCEADIASQGYLRRVVLLQTRDSLEDAVASLSGVSNRYL